MKYVITSSFLPHKCEQSLSGMGFSILKAPKWEVLQNSVSSHPDMLFFIYEKNYVTSFAYRNIAENIFGVLDSLGYTPIITDEISSAEYPNDILFNCFSLKKRIYGLKAHISKGISELASKNSLDIVNVKQGYAKCSTLKVSENAIVTADVSIAAAARSFNTDVLLIDSGNIQLDGYGYGFIGGASGSFEDKIYFCGNLSSHPDGEKIKSFCQKHKKECISLSDDILFDVGTLFFV